jgi:hypothetical protein
MPDPRVADSLHYKNIQRIGEGDIIMASYGASGAAMLGNIVLELGFHYVNPGTEELLPDGSARAPETMITYRGRLPATHRWDAGSARAPHGEGPRFVKTHLFPEDLAERRFDGVWLLTRDPRDCLYSWYRWRQNFPDMEWEKFAGTFAEFMAHRDYTGYPPAEGWTTFHAGWLRRAEGLPRMAVTRFEDLKRDPVNTTRRALNDLGLHAPDDDLREAAARSTYEAMRAHEDKVADLDRDKGNARIMRRGKIGEWTEWMEPQLSVYFADGRLREVAARFGYDLS